MPNRLARATSPYLLQHAENPVDWYEWGEEAFAEARRRDVPVLVSVGYAACHWCHVMAHESFEDPSVAALLNAHFVNVKVDREERPDVDAVYMAATQAMTGRGGWPMTVVATPDGEPFYAGTYYPPRPAHGLPSLTQVVGAVVEAWSRRPSEVRDSAAHLRDLLAARHPAPPPDADRTPLLGDAALAKALAALRGDHDAARGGFGGAPKFPPSTVLEWLLRHHARTGSPEALAMVDRTLEAMARGGIYDQLRGGFARYSVDAGWVVPHFEKMLDDNALLLRVYAHAWRATGSALTRRVVEETAAMHLDDLRTPEGGFASSLDADSRSTGADPDAHPEEGAYYVWTPARLCEVLGPDDGAWAADVLGVTEQGTFERGASVLQLRRDPDDGVRWASVRRRLSAVRARRPAPARDDKVVSGWNGLTIAALADAGAIFDRPDWVMAAARAGELLVRLHLEVGRDGSVRLARASRGGAAGGAPGVLEDYAYLAEGLLALYQATGEDRWAGGARGVLDAVLTRFPGGDGAFFDTDADRTDSVVALLGRPRELADGPTPSGTAAAAGALLTYAALTGSERHRSAAQAALEASASVATRYPRAGGWALAVAEALLDGPREVAIVGRTGDPSTRALQRTAARGTAPGAVVAVGEPLSGGGRLAAGGPASPPVGGESDGAEGAVVGLLLDRPLVGGRPTAYVCRRFLCERPVTEPADLARLVGDVGAAT